MSQYELQLKAAPGNPPEAVRLRQLLKAAARLGFRCEAIRETAREQKKAA